MNTQTTQAILKSPQMEHAPPLPQPQQTPAPAMRPSASSNFTNPLKSPQVSQVAGLGQHQHVPTATARLPGQDVAPPMSFPQSYQHPPGHGPPQHQHAQTTITGSIVNPSWTGHYMQHVTTMPNQSLPSTPAMLHHASYPQPQRHMQSQIRDPPQNVLGTGEKSQGSVQVQGVFTAQPELVKGMECAEMSEEERKKQRRTEQLAKARHCAGQTCIITGKICVVTCSVMAAVCSVVACLANCLPGDSPGMMGGGGGLSFSMPTD
jgi:hypothetical protein